MLFLIAYDIANPGRLRRVARRLERHALRVQKSVFLFRGSEEELVLLLDDLNELIDADLDVVLDLLDDHTRSRVAALISSVTGERPGAVARKYRAKLERGFWTWEVPGARLVVLSSLAPHAPSALIRRPAWMQPDQRPQPAKKPRKPKPKTTPVKKPNPSPGWEAD